VPETLIEYVHSNVPVFKKGGSGTHKEDEGKKVPFQFLSEDVTGVENIAHDHVDEDDDYDNSRSPGRSTAYPLSDGVYATAKFSEKIDHQFTRGISTPARASDLITSQKVSSNHFARRSRQGYDSPPAVRSRRWRGLHPGPRLTGASCLMDFLRIHQISGKDLRIYCQVSKDKIR
jgi:hypothetical protein